MLSILIQQDREAAAAATTAATAAAAVTTARDDHSATMSSHSLSGEQSSLLRRIASVPDLTSERLFAPGQPSGHGSAPAHLSSSPPESRPVVQRNSPEPTEITTPAVRQNAIFTYLPTEQLRSAWSDSSSDGTVNYHELMKNFDPRAPPTPPVDGKPLFDATDDFFTRTDNTNAGFSDIDKITDGSPRSEEDHPFPFAANFSMPNSPSNADRTKAWIEASADAAENTAEHDEFMAEIKARYNEMGYEIHSKLIDRTQPKWIPQMEKGFVSTSPLKSTVFKEYEEKLAMENEQNENDAIVYNIAFRRHTMTDTRAELLAYAGINVNDSAAAPPSPVASENDEQANDVDDSTYTDAVAMFERQGPVYDNEDEEETFPDYSEIRAALDAQQPSFPFLYQEEGDIDPDYRDAVAMFERQSPPYDDEEAENTADFSNVREMTEQQHASSSHVGTNSPLYDDEEPGNTANSSNVREMTEQQHASSSHASTNYQPPLFEDGNSTSEQGESTT